MAVAWRVKVYAPRAPHVRRFASAPLRRYVDILAQRQLLAILRGSQPLSPERARAAMGDALTLSPAEECSRVIERPQQQQRQQQ